MNRNYRTLNKDIGLIQRTNGEWDLWFENGDTVKAEDFHSLQTGIILACLTSWNYLNRYGNPTYEIFGNRSYELLKSNKNSMVAYKIQQYFIECLKRMRRVYEIVYLNVSDLPNEPYKYLVEFEVISINNELVSGSFDISTDTSKSSSYIDCNVYMPYASNENPLSIDLWLRNEYGGGLGGEILYMYLKKDNGDYDFVCVVGKTDSDGYIKVTYEPTDNNENNVIYFDFQGNPTYNPSTSERITFKTELYQYYIQFTNEYSTTITNYTDLKLKLRKKSLLDDVCYDMDNTTITVIGSDGRIYNAVTDENGEAIIRVKITENTLFTTTYGASIDYIDITIIKQTPIINFTTNKTELLMGELLELRAIVTDESNNLLKDFEVTFKDANDEIVGTAKTDSNGVAILQLTTLEADEYSFTANGQNTNFYNAVETESITVTIDKHTPTIDVTVQESPLVIGQTIRLTALVTEDGSRLYDQTVSFTENNVEIGTAITTDGIATIDIDTLGVGEHTITATVIENDYYVTTYDTITFTIIDHNYDLDLSIRKVSSSIQNNNTITYGLEIVPNITDNNLDVATLDLTDNNIVLSSEDTGDEWTITQYTQNETVYYAEYNTINGETVTVTATWDETTVTEEITLPVWEDDCSINSTTNYPNIYFGEIPNSQTPVVSDDLCKNRWTEWDGEEEYSTYSGGDYTLTNSSIQTSSDLPRLYFCYTATQPVIVGIRVTTLNQWQYADGVRYIIRRGGEVLDWADEETMEAIGHGISPPKLNIGDKLYLSLEESQTVLYTIHTIEFPEIIFSYDSSEQTYILQTEDNENLLIGKTLPKQLNSNMKISCKVKLTSNSNDTLLGIGLSDSLDFTTNKFDMFNIFGNGDVEHTRKTSDKQITSLWDDTGVGTFQDNWVTLELTVNNNAVIGKVYDENMDVLTTSTSQNIVGYTNKYVFIMTNTETALGNYVKDIKVENIEN